MFFFLKFITDNIWRTELDFMVTHKDRLIVLSFMTSPYQNLTTEHPNQSDLIDTRFLDNGFDETRLIERYREDNDDYDDDIDDDEDLFDLQNNLDNESAITFTTGGSNNFTDIWSTNPTSGFNLTSSKFETTLESFTEPTTTVQPSTTMATSTVKERARHKKKYPKNGNRNRDKNKKNQNNNNNKSSEEEQKYEIKSDMDFDFDKMIDSDLPPIFEGVKPSSEQMRPKKPNQRLRTTDSTYDERSPRPPRRHQIKESNIHIVKPEKVPENAIPSTPVSTNSKIIEIKPSPGSKNLSRKSRHHSDVDLEFEIQSVDEDDFIIRDEVTGEIIRPSYLVGGIPENISLQYKELQGIAGFVQRILGNNETFGEFDGFLF